MKKLNVVVLLLVKLTEVTEQWQQVCGVAEPQRRQREGHLGRVECHGEVLNELGGQALLHQRHVGGHVVGQEDEHADVAIHLDLSDLNDQRTWTQGQDGSIGPVRFRAYRSHTDWPENTHRAAQI